MSGYLFIASRDPWSSPDAAEVVRLAARLARSNQAVTVFLVQNAVLGARLGASTAWLDGLAGAGVEVLADELSLRERGISTARLVSGVKPSPIDIIVDALLAGRKTFWH